VTGEAEANAAITVTLPNDETAEGVTDADGNFEVALPEGTELAADDVLSVVATDEAGNTSDPTEVTVEEVPDTTAPEAPTVAPVYTDAITVTGEAEANAAI